MSEHGWIWVLKPPRQQNQNSNYVKKTAITILNRGEKKIHEENKGTIFIIIPYFILSIF